MHLGRRSLLLLIPGLLILAGAVWAFAPSRVLDAVELRRICAGPLNPDPFASLHGLWHRPVVRAIAQIPQSLRTVQSEDLLNGRAREDGLTECPLADALHRARFHPDGCDEQSDSCMPKTLDEETVAALSLEAGWDRKELLLHPTAPNVVDHLPSMAWLRRLRLNDMSKGIAELQALASDHPGPVSTPRQTLDLRALSATPNLRELTIQRYALRNPQALVALKDLRTLTLIDTPGDGPLDLSFIAKMPALESVTLEKVHASDSWPVATFHTSDPPTDETRRYSR